MKTLVSIYAGDGAEYAFEPVFDGDSAFDRVCSWVCQLAAEGGCGQIDGAVVFVHSGHEQKVQAAVQGLSVPVSIVTTGCNGAGDFLAALSSRTAGCDTVIHARCGCPFYDSQLTARLYSLHVDTAAEYTFADGWPEGFAPVVVCADTVAVLSSLASRNGAGNVTREVFFDVMRSDINSFEVETLMAPEDMRQYRLDFACETRSKMLACVRLYEAAGGSNADRTAFLADNLSSKAVFSPAVLRTVPAFYNVQISAACPGTCVYCPYPAAYESRHGHKPSEAVRKNSRCFMPLERIKVLAESMAELSGEAVVSLSLWGEPLSHPELAECVAAILQHRGLSVLLETDGMLAEQQLVERLAAIAESAGTRTNGMPPIVWIVSLDAEDGRMYSNMRGMGRDNFPLSYEKACAAVELLEKSFSGAVYSQFVRTTINEEQLEPFYRRRKDSGGMIIQKYDNFAGAMPDYKVADLSPLIRNPCWHQRRDMVILVDGSVPVCREFVLDGMVGNVFSEPLGDVWDRGRNMAYTDKCRDCDEYYTFNF